jgi:Zn-dependent protease
MFNLDLQQLLEFGLAMIISLSFHELAHARTALAFGDPTAKMMGRVTLNPLAHLDPLGSILFFMAGGLGWAKPVPVNPANLHPPRLGDFLVSLAGPMANFALAIFCAMLLRLLIHLPTWAIDRPYLHSLAAFLEVHQFTWSFLVLLMWCNLGLMIFNLIPLYPLDGHHLQRDVLPTHLQVPFMNWQLAYGRYVLIGLMTLSFFASKINPGFQDPLSRLIRYVGLPIYEWLVYA